MDIDISEQIKLISAKLEENADHISAMMSTSTTPSPDRYKRTIYMLETILKHYRFAQLDNKSHYDFIDDKHSWRDTMFASAYNSGDEVSQTLKSLITAHYQDIIKIFTHLTYNTGSLDDNNVDIFVSRIVKATWPILFNGELYRNDSNNYMFVDIPVHKLELHRVLN